MGGISSEIPDPTFGYIRGSSMGYQMKDDALRINLIGADFGADLGNLVYVDKYGEGDIEMTFLCQKSLRMCRYQCDTREDGDHQEIVE